MEKGAFALSCRGVIVGFSGVASLCLYRFQTLGPIVSGWALLYQQIHLAVKKHVAHIMDRCKTREHNNLSLPACWSKTKIQIDLLLIPNDILFVSIISSMINISYGSIIACPILNINILNRILEYCAIVWITGAYPINLSTSRFGDIDLSFFGID